MPKKGGSGSKDVTSENKYRIVDKALNNPAKAEARRRRNKGATAEEEGGDGAEGNGQELGEENKVKAVGTYAHLRVDSEDEPENEEKPAKVESGPDPLHSGSGSYTDTHDKFGESVRKILFSFQTSLEWQSVIFIAVLMEAALAIAAFAVGEHKIFPEEHKRWISMAVLYLLVADLFLKVMHKAGPPRCFHAHARHAVISRFFCFVARGRRRWGGFFLCCFLKSFSPHPLSLTLYPTPNDSP